MTHYDLEGRVAIVTGASSGLGEQFANALAECGAAVVLAARRGDILHRLADELTRRYSSKTLAVETDVARETDIVALVARTIDQFGTVDILVNNAGMYIAKPLTEQTLDDWRTVVDVNLTSAFLGCREVAKVMIPKGSGSIVNIASTFAFGGTIFPEVGYYASKGGIVALTKALAVELGSHNIRVNAIAPGFFPTPMSIRAISDDHIRATVIEARTALTSLPENEWIRGSLCFLVSDDARYVTGHTLAVDGGWLAF